MGFEYGYSVANGDALVCWEGQFGDFFNGAQVVIDQFVSAGEDKWGQESGLVLLLPHGFEGQGPEHSSARIERFLSLAAEDSIQVVQPTDAAQYFHVLRRQLKRTVRKPLVVFTPKWLLRLPDARSKLDDFLPGTSFQETIDDPQVPDPEKVERILLCTGKVSYLLGARRNELEAPAAVVRVEQLYPFPGDQLGEIFARYPNADQVVWVQEEPENMGAWRFIWANLRQHLDKRLTLRQVSRPESASPATGSSAVHEQEQEELLTRAFT
jgi:2-oxoglutarate dehydrogenase E1 component